jgi:hypothetical protein
MQLRIFIIRPFFTETNLRELFFGNDKKIEKQIGCITHEIFQSNSLNFTLVIDKNIITSAKVSLTAVALCIIIGICQEYL